MAKSLRNKQKVAARRQKRTDSHYAVHEADRLARISANLVGKGEGSKPFRRKIDWLGDEVKKDEEANEGEEDVVAEDGVVAVGDDEKMDIKEEDDESTTPTARPSTSGERDSGREQWRVAKGMSRRPERHGMNRQGMAKARKSSGRPHRRR